MDVKRIKTRGSKFSRVVMSQVEPFLNRREIMTIAATCTSTWKFSTIEQIKEKQFSWLDQRRGELIERIRDSLKCHHKRNLFERFNLAIECGSQIPSNSVRERVYNIEQMYRLYHRLRFPRYTPFPDPFVFSEESFWYNDDGTFFVRRSLLSYSPPNYWNMYIDSKEKLNYIENLVCLA
jgi:hypothetical protein